MKKGFITIIGLFIISVILISSLFLIYCSTLQVPMAMSTLHKIQSKYVVEDKLNRLIYDRDVFNKYLRANMLEICRLDKLPKNKLWSLNFKDNPALKEYLKKAEYLIEDIDGRLSMVLTLEGNYNNMERKIVNNVSIINDILELGEGLINGSDLLEEEARDFQLLMEEIHREAFDYDYMADSDVKIYNGEKDLLIRNEGLDKNSIFTINDGVGNFVDSFNKETIIINLIHPLNKKINLSIGEIGNSSLIKGQGLLYVEGDLILNQEFLFDGVIIINGGNLIINTSEPSLVNGMVLYYGESNFKEEKFKILYNRNHIIKYGSYMPGFLKPKVNLTKTTYEGLK